VVNTEFSSGKSKDASCLESPTSVVQPAGRFARLGGYALTKQTFRAPPAGAGPSRSAEFGQHHPRRMNGNNGGHMAARSSAGQRVTRLLLGTAVEPAWRTDKQANSNRRHGRVGVTINVRTWGHGAGAGLAGGVPPTGWDTPSGRGVAAYTAHGGTGVRLTERAADGGLRRVAGWRRTGSSWRGPARRDGYIRSGRGAGGQHAPPTSGGRRRVGPHRQDPRPADIPGRRAMGGGRGRVTEKHGASRA